MAMKEDRAREGKKAQYRKMGFGPMMKSGEIDFGDKHPLLKAKKEKQKNYQNPKKDERFNAAFRSRAKKAGLKDSEIGDTRLKKGGLSGGQAKIAAKAPPTNKIDAKDFAVLRAEKAKGRGKGLQDEKVKPGKVMKAKEGKTIKKDPTKTVNPFMKRRKELMGIKQVVGKGGRLGAVGAAVASGVAAFQALKTLKSEKKALKKENKKMGGGLAAATERLKAKGLNKGGGADTGTMGERKSRIGVTMNKAKRFRKRLRLTESDVQKAGDLLKSPKGKALDVTNRVVDILKSSKKMGGGMMNKPMGYKSGKSVMAKGCKLGRKKPTKMY